MYRLTKFSLNLNESTCYIDLDYLNACYFGSMNEVMKFLDQEKGDGEIGRIDENTYILRSCGIELYRFFLQEYPDINPIFFVCEVYNKHQIIGRLYGNTQEEVMEKYKINHMQGWKELSNGDMYIDYPYAVIRQVDTTKYLGVK